MPKRPNAQVALDAASAIASDPELVQLLKQGHFIPALKRYRDQHGVGLEEAKAALEAWRSQATASSKVAKVIDTAASDVVSDPQIVAAIRKRNFIEAIKLYRAKTGVSLQDAKEAIDTWRRNMGQ
jgi:ribosomal protein L7/L12